MNELRVSRLIAEAIKACRLDLGGLTVLTEAASGYYALTPVIAAMAGAQEVLVYGRTTRFGSVENVSADLMALAARHGVAGRIKVLSDKYDRQVGSADIVTNLAMLRPLDARFLALLKPTVAIPLMWETWEFREADLDLPECHKRGIPVLGTDEHQPALQIFDYVGMLPVKLLLGAEIEIFRSRIVVLGQGEFAALSARALGAAGAQIDLIETGDTDWRVKLLSVAGRADALCVVDMHSRQLLIGKGGTLDVSDLISVAPGITVAHVCGGVEREGLVAAGVRCVPDSFAPAGYMSVATDFAGPRPLIDLHTAGLRVGEVMARCRLKGLDRLSTETETLQMEPLAQAFP